MTAAVITSHWIFRRLSNRCAAKTCHSAALSYRTTKVCATMQVKSSSHGLRTDDPDPDRLSDCRTGYLQSSRWRCASTTSGASGGSRRVDRRHGSKASSWPSILTTPRA